VQEWVENTLIVAREKGLLILSSPTQLPVFADIYRRLKKPESQFFGCWKILYPSTRTRRKPVEPFIDASSKNRIEESPMKTEPRSKSLLMTGRELMSLKPAEQEWIVDGLLRTNRKRPSVLAGKPESGKSCLSKQLAVAVLQGRSFLGRQTIQADVLYWCTEDTPEDIQDSFKHLGYDPDRDRNLFVFKGDCEQNSIDSLHDVLGECPGVKLVIIETLDDLLKLKDIKENTAARQAFDKFNSIVMKKFCHRVAFLGLHHIKKRETESSGDGLLGASVIRGRTDGKWYLKTKSDDDPRRIFHTEVRKGKNIEQTYLDYNAETETSTLGITVAEERKLGAGKTGERIKQAILEYFVAHPDSSFEKDCLPVIDGNSDLKRKMFRELVARDFLIKGGKGSKASPFVYRVPEIPVEVAA
jgi:hypothetical protein